MFVYSMAAHCAFGVAGSLLVGGVLFAETRTWTDSTGKFKIEANFLEIVEGQVKLDRTDGKKMSLPLAKLSKDDQAFLQNLMKKRRSGATEEENPFETEAGSASPRGIDRPRPGSRRSQRRHQETQGGWQLGDKVEVREHRNWQLGEIVGFDPEWDRVFVKLDDGGRMIQTHDDEHSLRAFDPALGPIANGRVANLDEVDLTSIRRIVPLGGASGDFQPDPASDAKADWKPKPVGLSPKAGFFENVVGVSFTNVGTTAVVGHSGGAGVDDDQSRIDICDLKTGRVTAMAPGPRYLKKVAVSPSGKRLATICEVETFVSSPLQIWEVADKGLKPLKAWHVSADVDHRQVEWIGWVDDEHVMTVDRNGLTMWSVDGPRGEYQVTGDGMTVPAFSPGGKQFAIGTDKGFSIHDVATGELLTKIAMDHGFQRKVAFSPSGMLLAATGSSTVEVFDATTGEKGIEAYCSSAHSDMGLCWLGEEHVLVGGTDLIHLPSQMTVWKYDHNAETVVPRAGRVWYVFGGRGDDPLALLPFQLPHPAVKPVAEKELVLKPGDEVSIQMELTFDLGQDPSGNPVSAQDQLKTSLTNAGFLVVDNANKRLVGRTLPGESKEIEYRMFGRPFNDTEKASYTQRVLELELVVDGEVVWQRRRVMDAPMHIQLKENETLDQAINRHLQADTGFFRSTVPSRVLPTAAEKARTSTLSTNGIE